MFCYHLLWFHRVLVSGYMHFRLPLTHSKYLRCSLYEHLTPSGQSFPPLFIGEDTQVKLYELSL